MLEQASLEDRLFYPCCVEPLCLYLLRIPSVSAVAATRKVTGNTLPGSPAAGTPVFRHPLSVCSMLEDCNSLNCSRGCLATLALRDGAGGVWSQPPDSTRGSAALWPLAKLTQDDTSLDDLGVLPQQLAGASIHAPTPCQHHPLSTVPAHHTTCCLLVLLHVWYAP